MAKKVNHMHVYKKVRIKKSVIFRCTVIGCAHYIQRALAEGRICACNRCGMPMSLSKANMKLTYPHCIDCTIHKDKDIDILKELIGG